MAKKNKQNKAKAAAQAPAKAVETEVKEASQEASQAEVKTFSEDEVRAAVDTAVVEALEDAHKQFDEERQALAEKDNKPKKKAGKFNAIVAPGRSVGNDLAGTKLLLKDTQLAHLSKLGFVEALDS